MPQETEKLCRIRDIQRSIIIFEQQFEKCHGIGLNEGMLLCSLCKSGNLSSGELSDLLGLTPSNTSKVIASAEEKELITRILGTKDKRQMYFSLSEKGKQLLFEIKCKELEIPELLQNILKAGREE